MGERIELDIDEREMRQSVNEVLVDLNAMLRTMQGPTRDAVGEHIAAGIKANTRKGRDMNDRAFQKYAASTVRSKTKKGQQTRPVNLTDEGVMVKGVRYVKSGFLGFIESAGRPEVTIRHQRGRGRLPVRAWFGVGPKSKLAITAGKVAAEAAGRSIKKNRKGSYEVVGKAAESDGKSVLIIDTR